MAERGRQLVVGIALLAALFTVAAGFVACGGRSTSSSLASPVAARVIAVRKERNFSGVTFPVYYVLTPIAATKTQRLAQAREVLRTARDGGAIGDVRVRFVDRPQYVRWRAAPLGQVVFTAKPTQTDDVALPARGLAQRPSAWQADAYAAWVMESRREADPTTGFFNEARVVRVVAKRLGVPTSRVQAAVDKVEAWL